MKNFRRMTAIILFGVMLCFCGCRFAINYDLPDEPIVFEPFDYASAADTGEVYGALEYNGRIYIPYGTIRRSMTGRDVGECLGYIRCDDKSDTDTRVYLLKADGECNYLMEYYVAGLMEQPLFWRAADTLGKDIFTPDFIESLDYDFWQN